MARFSTAGNVWQLELSHQEVQEIASGGATGAAIATKVGQPWLGAILVAIAGVLVTVDGIGGDNGVNVVGVLQTQFVTVTPASVSPVDLVKGFADALVRETGLPGGVVGAGLGAGVALLAVGPAGVVLGGLAGFLAAQGNDGPNPGDVWADRRQVGAWERFTLVTVTVRTRPAIGKARWVGRVAIGSWRGYFCAENGGGNQVHANRHEIGPWETAQLIHNPNGTVSVRAGGGHYLTAEGGGGDGGRCNWDRTEIGPWEQFWMEFQPKPFGGTFALKTFSQGTYVSVQ
jgi:hypothetical protein